MRDPGCSGVEEPPDSFRWRKARSEPGPAGVETAPIDLMIGNCPAMQEVYKAIGQGGLEKGQRGRFC